MNGLEITSLKIELARDGIPRLRATAMIVLNNVLCIKNIRIVEDDNGIFLAMPSRKTVMACPHCRHRIPIDVNYCSHCGTRQVEEHSEFLYRDVVHPTSAEVRSWFEEIILGEYERLDKASGARR